MTAIETKEVREAREYCNQLADNNDPQWWPLRYSLACLSGLSKKWRDRARLGKPLYYNPEYTVFEVPRD